MQLKCPNGYRFEIEKEYSNEDDKKSEYSPEDSWVIKLYHNNDWVGYIDLAYDKRPAPFESFFEMHSSLDEEERNKKLGALLYSKAIEVAMKKGIKIKSSLEPSPDAIRVWKSKSLNSKYEIVWKNNRFNVVGRKCNPTQENDK